MVSEKESKYMNSKIQVESAYRELERTIALLHKLSKQYYMVRFDGISLHDKKGTVQNDELLESMYAQSEVLTNIVEMLKSKQNFMNIAEKMLENICTHLDISNGVLLQINKHVKQADLVCEWSCEYDNAVSGLGHGLSKKDLSYWDGLPHIISSSRQVSAEFENILHKYNIKAGIFLPVEVNEKLVIYLVFAECRREKEWEESEIAFLQDVRNLVKGIAARCITQEFLEGAYASLEAILENVICGICVQDGKKKQILFTNKMFRTSFGQQDRELILYKKNKQKTLDEKWHKELHVKDKDLWYNIHYTKIKWIDGSNVTLITTNDITDMKRAQQKMENQANNDFLTGLHGRMRCELDLEKYIEETKKHYGQAALLYIDLDDFKYINDGLGHQYGDVLLKAISHSIQRIDGIENTCYRMGGDEFIVIVTDQSFSKLTEIITQINKIFSKPWYLKGADYYCTMSMGIAIYPKDGDTVQELIKKADVALFEAKKRGKNRHEFYNDTVEISSVKRLDLEKNMRNATKDACAEFEVYYQPIIDITKPGSPCAGAEALIRWNSQSLGFVTPQEFIPLAEYLGLINPIGNHILQKACMECKNWNNHDHPEFKVNVNLSIVQLLQNDITSMIKKILDETKITPSNLTLEVTENLAINDMARMKWILGEIKNLGVRVALDDFGTGYSSLNHIRELPIDVIKIDRCFIQDLGRDEYAELFVKMVAELASTIGVKMCIEGVETRQQYDILKDMKIHMIQGFYFDKPLSRKEFAEKYIS